LNIGQFIGSAEAVASFLEILESRLAQKRWKMMKKYIEKFGK